MFLNEEYLDGDGEKKTLSVEEKKLSRTKEEDQKNSNARAVEKRLSECVTISTAISDTCQWRVRK